MSHDTERSAAEERNASAYWNANVRLMIGCLIVWAVVSFGLGILLRPILGSLQLGGADIGFWFAQQGSILVFIVLIFFYAVRMSRLDRQYDVDEQ